MRLFLLQLSLAFALLFPVIAAAESLVIGTASSLRFVVEDLVKGYQAQRKDAGQPRLRVAISSASSGTLATQIRQGAPFDIFICANRDYALSVDGLQQQAFGSAQLVIASDNTIPDLAKSEQLRIAIANPATAPFGELAWQYLEQNQLLDKHKIIRSNNAQLAYQALERQLVDLALVSSVQTRNLTVKERVSHNTSLKTIATNMPPLSQYIVLTKSTTASQAFYDFVIAGQANSILENHGLSVDQHEENKP